MPVSKGFWAPWIQAGGRWVADAGRGWESGWGQMDCWATLSLSTGRPIVTIGGELDLATAPQVQRALSAALVDLRPADPSMLVDLHRLEFMDTSGLGLLLRARKAAREHGSDLVLIAPAPRVRRVLSKTNLLQTFNVYPSVSAAPTH